MKRSVVAATCAVLLAGGAALAQQNKDEQNKGERITVRGCLSVNAASRAYILTAKPDPLAQTVTGAAAGPTTVEYQLVGGNGLQHRVGNTIEVTGIVDPKTTATARSESERSGPAANAQQSGKKPRVETKTETSIRAQMMRVESFRTISRSCEPTR